jgi:DnaK suppressor protein
MITTTDDIIQRLQTELIEARHEWVVVSEEATHPPEVELGGGSPGYSAWQTAIVLKRHVEDRIEELEAAITRAEAGLYGICEYCGEPIPTERLDVLPFTNHCVGCASVAHPHVR